jgi:hypothetical protein
MKKVILKKEHFQLFGNHQINMTISSGNVPKYLIFHIPFNHYNPFSIAFNAHRYCKMYDKYNNEINLYLAAY